MAKRKKASVDGFAITARSDRARLIKEARNARRRISTYKKRHGEATLAHPVEYYTMKEIDLRLAAGQPVAAIFAELQGVGSSTGRKSGSKKTVTDGEYPRAQIAKEARKARRRISEFGKKYESTHFKPPREDYTMAALDNRLNAGESPESILSELRGITRKSLLEGTAGEGEKSVSGFRLSPRESRQLRNAIAEANKNIKAAHDKYGPDFRDLLPELFDADQIVLGMTSKEQIQNKIKDLSVFTPDKLEIVPINDAGEAGTQAEVEYWRNILERENARKAQLREETDPRGKQGYFVMQSEYDLEPINIDKLQTMEQLRSRGNTWEDINRIYRANQWLVNYGVSLTTFESVLINQGIWNDEIKAKFDYIRSILEKAYYNEKAINYLVYRMPFLQIDVISPPGGIGSSYASIDFDEILKEWKEFDKMWYGGGG